MGDTGNQLDKNDQRFPRDEQDLTPPHGDELRSEVTFGRTDRYSNVDEEATEQPDEGDRKAP